MSGNAGRWRQARAGWLVPVVRLWVLLTLLACLGTEQSGAAATSSPLVLTVRLSPGEWQTALDVSTGHLFLANRLVGNVEMRTATTGNLLHTIAVGQGGLALMLASRQRRLFVAHGDDLGRHGSVLTVDTRTGRVLGTAEVGPYPQLALLDEGAGRVLVSTETISTRGGRQRIIGGLVLLDIDSGQVTARIPFPGTLNGAALDEQRHRAILVADTQGDVPARTMQYGVLDLQGGHYQPIADSNENGQRPVLDRRRGIAMIVDTDEGTIHVIDIATGAVRHVIRVDPFPSNGVIDPTSGHAYVVATVAATVSTMDLAAGSVLNRTPVTLITSPISDTAVLAEATGISLDTAGDRAFVALTNGQLALVNTLAGRLMRRLSVGVVPAWLPAFVSHGLAYSMSTGEVTHGTTIDVRAGGKLTVFDPHDGRVVRTVAVGQSPSWPPVEDVSGAHLFFTSGGPSAGFNAFPSGPGSVSIVDAATSALLQHITVGFIPSLIGLDAANGRLLVLNAAGDSTAPAGPGPVCSAKTYDGGPNPPSCRTPWASLSIIRTAS